ncbi:PREDICTED: uncharacterized protein LOC105462504 [Wasmannia auropunctata]|uniref:uncharacterized protein LOC105462504 n=1 Tax=Wasmannia auropunctata TaxID=64793 RepID=UPI0005ED767A|nr:PREDICTED: uncharacterized protein LOC105462504 [Wasmannia auropunctata]XP_011707443.1 PREDICTED: uncharacterized protein LOC105462504 [Wasmannia auropunctata]
MTMTLEEDIRELRGILEENSSHLYNTNNLRTQQDPPVYKAQEQISTQPQNYPQEQISNSYHSLQIPVNTESYSTLSCAAPSTERLLNTTRSSTFVPNQYNTLDNNINTYNKFQANYPNSGESMPTKANYNAQLRRIAENEVENQ